MVEIAHVRAAVIALLNQIEQKHGTTVDLDGDLYWDIDPSVAYNPLGEPAEGLWTSQLSDNVDSLAEFLQRGDDDIPMVWHDLAHLTGILRRLAYLDQPSSAR